MPKVNILAPGQIGKNFIPAAFLPENTNEYHIRDQQNPFAPDKWRHLNSDELEQLVKNNNTADNWDDILVTDPFTPKQIKSTHFHGLVRIGALRDIILEHHDLRVPSGITNSIIIACDIGDDAAIHGVRYLAHYIIGNRCILMNIHEMHTTNYAKFGNGIVKEGEPEEVRIWMDLMNEAGGRNVIPFDGMIAADAYLWARYRDDRLLQHKLKEITQTGFNARRGFYGTVGEECVIKNSLILKDVKIGSNCYIKGANKLKNLTINSSQDESTQIGEGCELVNGIVGFGCRIFYGCKAVRFVLGCNSSLKYGARLIHSFLGANSTISCCEVLNNLIFPAHEQHHNNSFLIASLVQGQSNIAAGATIGSNHNSRANDNEIIAGRGFWPGLCTSLKHSCRFASFTLLAKSDYPYELNIPLPFSLLNNNAHKDCLEVTPAFWWMYNMYAFARNAWKFTGRDKRKIKTQHIEFDPLAPDTVEEIINARRLLEIWTAKAHIKIRGESDESYNQNDLAFSGKELLKNAGRDTSKLEVLGEHMEKSSRKTIIHKVHQAYHAYENMLYHYSIKNILDYIEQSGTASFESIYNNLKGERIKNWANLGGQLIPECDVDKLRADIGTGKYSDWDQIHKKYDDFWKEYPLQKQKHAFAVLCMLYETQNLSFEQWKNAFKKAIKIQDFISDQVYTSRKKDYDNPFRQATYRNLSEMTAAIGTVDDNTFILQVREETKSFKKRVEKLLQTKQ